ncbi:MAG: hypothetical protein ABI844_15685 [Saprospiraceae bacterium]
MKYLFYDRSGYLLRFSFILVVLCTIACNKKNDDTLDTYSFPDEPIFFDHVPIDLDGVRSFVPMGEPNVYPKDHGGFPLKNPQVLPASIPVFAVASGVIIIVGRGIRHLPNGTEYDDYRIRLQVSKNVVVNFGHISELNFDLLPELHDLPIDEMGHEASNVVKAGDIIGWVGPHGAMDFSITDRSLKLNLLNPSRYPEDHIYSADIYHYFKSPQLEEMIRIAARDAPPWGGKVDYDISGRIVGNWFLKGTTSQIQWSHQLSIVYDHLLSERIFISDGSPMKDVPGFQNPGAPDIWWVKGNSPRPETIGTSDGIVQYSLISPHGSAPVENKPIEGVMLVQMVDENSIRVEVFKGSTSKMAFTTAARMYER